MQVSLPFATSLPLPLRHRPSPLLRRRRRRRSPPLALSPLPGIIGIGIATAGIAAALLSHAADRLHWRQRREAASLSVRL